MEFPCPSDHFGLLCASTLIMPMSIVLLNKNACDIRSMLPHTSILEPKQSSKNAEVMCLDSFTASCMPEGLTSTIVLAIG